MGNNVIAFVQCHDGEIKRTQLEAVSEGARIANALGGGCVAVVMGSGAADAAAGLGRYGARTARAIGDAAVAHYNGDIYGRTVAALAREHDAAVIVASATAAGKDLCPRVAAHLEAGYAADATGVRVEDGKLLVTRPVYAGKALIDVGFESDVAVVSLRPNNFEVSEGEGSAEVSEAQPVLEGPSAKVLETRQTAGERADLTEASIIVSGGRGMKGPEHFQLLEELADVLGATVGASRAVVDAGWRPHSDQVGQTGKTVSPKLYIAVGISGAIQHIAGMRTSGCIVAINKDPDAPIFKIADYGIVGDLFEIVPRLTEELRKVLQN
ncbi:MAG: electron transfer flavoprotein subunit alpha/FixB family protein [Planctomycetota bacterium]|nr:MAG: electron transfer flavoprotein subunit alpha/FixB family protein [Planctomycetota bacterium]